MYSKSGVRLAALDEMLLGTDTLRFGGSLSFLQTIYLGMCFTGGLAVGSQPWASVAYYCCTSLWLNQVSQITGCLEPVIGKVLPFCLSLLFSWPVEQWQSEASWTHHERTGEGEIAGAQISAWVPYIWALGWPWEQVGLLWHPSHWNLPRKSVYLKELTKVLDIFYHWQREK